MQDRTAEGEALDEPLVRQKPIVRQTLGCEMVRRGLGHTVPCPTYSFLWGQCDLCSACQCYRGRARSRPDGHYLPRTRQNSLYRVAVSDGSVKKSFALSKGRRGLFQKQCDALEIFRRRPCVKMTLLLLRLLGMQHRDRKDAKTPLGCSPVEDCPHPWLSCLRLLHASRLRSWERFLLHSF